MTPEEATSPETPSNGGPEIPPTGATQGDVPRETVDDAAHAEAFAQITELARKAEERDRLMEQLQRVSAEFQNWKSRVAKEKADERRYAIRDTIRALLPALDNLERALAVDASVDPAAVIEGVRMTADQFRTSLESVGVKRVQCAGANLDPRCMDAVARVETSEHAQNVVVDVFEHGYTLQDLVVRPAKVAVAVSPSTPPAS